MNRATISKAVLAGMAGTVVMTVFSFISTYLHLPKMDFHGLIESHLPMGPLFTWVAYFGVGIVLAYLYGTFFKAKLPYHSHIRGMIYATMLWGAMEIVLMPVLGMGFFAGSMTVAFMALVAMALYGATLGYLYEAK